MSAKSSHDIGWDRTEISRNIALDIPDGAIVNLGIGLPETVAAAIPGDREILFHTENGLLGMGPPPLTGLGDPELVNAGKRKVTAIPGASFFHHADSFAMIRGGHIDICILGAMQVSDTGDLANWSTGDSDRAPAVGGAMDLVAGARTLYIAMTHCTKDGSPKLVSACTLPLTGRRVVKRIYTNWAILDVGPEGFVVERLGPGVTAEHLKIHTGGRLSFKNDREQ